MNHNYILTSVFSASIFLIGARPEVLRPKRSKTRPEPPPIPNLGELPA